MGANGDQIRAAGRIRVHDLVSGRGRAVAERPVRRPRKRGPYVEGRHGERDGNPRLSLVRDRQPRQNGPGAVEAGSLNDSLRIEPPIPGRHGVARLVDRHVRPGCADARRGDRLGGGPRRRPGRLDGRIHPLDGRDRSGPDSHGGAHRCHREIGLISDRSVRSREVLRGLPAASGRSECGLRIGRAVPGVIDPDRDRVARSVELDVRATLFLTRCGDWRRSAPRSRAGRPKRGHHPVVALRPHRDRVACLVDRHVRPERVLPGRRDLLCRLPDPSRRPEARMQDRRQIVVLLPGGDGVAVRVDGDGLAERVQPRHREVRFGLPVAGRGGANRRLNLAVRPAVLQPDRDRVSRTVELEVRIEPVGGNSLLRLPDARGRRPVGRADGVRRVVAFAPDGERIAVLVDCDLRIRGAHAVNRDRLAGRPLTDVHSPNGGLDHAVRARALAAMPDGEDVAHRIHGDIRAPGNVA